LSGDVAVLISAGLDSVVLAASEAQRSIVHPIYVAAGLAWESQELSALERVLAAPPLRDLRPLVRLAFSVEDLYPDSHWALRGEPPAFDTPDEDVYLVGRNIALLSKAAIHCARHRIPRIALGLLAGNPFPDATPLFFEAMASALSTGLGFQISIAAPFATLDKSEVIRLGIELGVPLELTLSCMNPRLRAGGASAGQAAIEHCGRCSKCRERRDAFRSAGVSDLTEYAATPPR
jgi:7-cyano-7-deazaguanine synthase